MSAAVELAPLLRGPIPLPEPESIIYSRIQSSQICDRKIGLFSRCESPLNRGLLRYASARPIALRQAGSAPATLAATWARRSRDEHGHEPEYDLLTDGTPYPIGLLICIIKSRYKIWCPYRSCRCLTNSTFLSATHESMTHSPGGFHPLSRSSKVSSAKSCRMRLHGLSGRRRHRCRSSTIRASRGGFRQCDSADHLIQSLA